MYLHYIVISAIWLLRLVGGKYLSLSSQVHLINTEPQLIGTIQKYVEAENGRLIELQRFRDSLTKNKEIYKTSDELVWNPLAIYRTVKYLTNDLENVENKIMMINSHNDTVPVILQEQNIHIPQQDDLYDVIRNLVHLQQVYDLKVIDINNGRLTPEISTGTGLSPEDCFYIGKVCAEKNDHETAVKWLRDAGGLFDTETQYEAAELLIPSSLFIGDKDMTKSVVNLSLRKEWSNRSLHDLLIKLNRELDQWAGEEYNLDQWKSFKTCVGDFESEFVSRNLTCRYNHHNSPFLILAPLKEEMLSLQPKVSIFREAVYDSEIQALKDQAFDVFRTATVLKDNGKRRAADLHYRPSQTAFLGDRESKFYNLYKRLEDLSALSLLKSEDFQMLHYAPGGFYRVHADYLPVDMEEILTRGNRIATALMYLNDVTMGGSTVFPRLGVRVQPVKGSVLFWINMTPDGSEELLTKHAACPVIYGEKLACTQWFRLGGQQHWVAESQDDAVATYNMKPYLKCQSQVERDKP